MKVQPQSIHPYLPELQWSRGLEKESEGGFASRWRRQPARKRGGLERRAGQRDRPQRHWVARGELARQTIHRFGVQKAMTVNEESIGQLSPRGIQFKLQ